MTQCDTSDDLTGPESAPDGARPAPERRVLAAAAVTVTLWASAFIGIRAAAPVFDAAAMALLRMVVGTFVLGLIAARAGFRWPPRQVLPLVLAWGVAWFCLYNIALNLAERALDSGTTAMIVNIAPLIVVLLAGSVLGEGFPRTLVVGAPLSFIGVLIIGSQSASRHVGLGGVALALAAAVLYAGCTLLQKRLLRSVDAATLTFLGAAAGTAALLPWAGRLASDLTTAPAAAIATVVYLGIFPTAIAFSTWAFVLSRISAGRTAATTYVVPAVAIALSWLLLGETPTGLTLIGGALCLLGVFVTRSERLGGLSRQ